MSKLLGGPPSLLWLLKSPCLHATFGDLKHFKADQSENPGNFTRLGDIKRFTRDSPEKYGNFTRL